MKRRRHYSLAAKFIGFVLLVLMAWTAAAGTAFAALMIDSGVYDNTQSTVLDSWLSRLTYSDCVNTLYEVMERDGETAAGNKAFSFVICDEAGEPVCKNFEPAESGAEYREYEHRIEYRGRSYSVYAYVNTAHPQTDRYALTIWLVGVGYALRYWIYVIILVSAAVFIADFVYLVSAAGHRPDRDEVKAGGWQKLPFDIVTAALAALVGAGVNILQYDAGVSLHLLLCTAALILLTIYFCDLAVRIKTGTLVRRTAVFRIGKLVFKALRFLLSAAVSLLKAIPHIPKACVLFCTASVLYLICIFGDPEETRFFLWIVVTAITLIVTVYIAAMLNRLLKASRALASGQLSYQVDTKYMVLDLRAAAENLNDVARGTRAAVDQQIKSERLKTELITNVSHDIKTPLTSIINYTDLICHEETDNENIRAFSGELLRQSERLKKLIDDLIEASKASTGNIEVELATCEVGVLLTQTAGEYEQKMADVGLTLVTRQPEEPIVVLADGKRLWRVFDNLMSNAWKYSQSGTRVYLTLERRENTAVISVKNTSSTELNIPAEELMGRFVRGDSSRSTEGSGLGLSIARSLVELQNGRLELTVDGDLFKAEVFLPIC